MKKILLTIDQFAEGCQVSTNTVRREIAEGKLRAIKVRGAVRIRVQDAIEYLQRLQDEFAEEYGVL